MPTNIIYGDIVKLALEGKFDVIVHGCNCFCKMNAGVAKAISSEFPEAYMKDLETISGDKTKLGTYSVARIKRTSKIFSIVNAYTQFNYGNDGKVYLNYDALANVFSKIAKDFPNEHIAYPKIGAGLAGGDWDIIKHIIDNMLVKHNHTLVINHV